MSGGFSQREQRVVSKKASAGLVIYRRSGAATEVFLVHPGGPFWQAKDLGAWSIPKGELTPDEDPLTGARREVREETGLDVSGEFRPLVPLRQPSGKIVHAWAVEGDCDPARITSNTFSLEWPPRSGSVQAFPEIDRAAWFSLDQAGERITKGQRGFLDQLRQLLDQAGGVPIADARRARMGTTTAQRTQPPAARVSSRASRGARTAPGLGAPRRARR
jgi:predicted NUDIX family NTP pyrophosphohydrolase